MRPHALAARYCTFAVIATLANLITQRAVLLSGNSPLQFALAVFAGTVAGLIIKYVLDKRWIFNDLTSDLKSHTRRFTLYTATGIATTFIFWGTETAFWSLWKADFMRELGALLGLGIGYVVKYQLDRRFVFADSRLAIRAVA